MDFDYFSWIILPILIFISRLGDVTMATLRHIFVSKGFKKIVPLLGFFEVLIWLVAMRQVFSHLDNFANEKYLLLVDQYPQLELAFLVHQRAWIIPCPRKRLHRSQPECQAIDCQRWCELV